MMNQLAKVNDVQWYGQCLKEGRLSFEESISYSYGRSNEVRDVKKNMGEILGRCVCLTEE